VSTEISQQTKKEVALRGGTVASRVRSACIETDFADVALPIQSRLVIDFSQL
jgi:hypothetical protein